MRITDSSPDRLTLEDRPLLLGAMLIGVILMVLFVALRMLWQGDMAGLWMLFVAAGFGLAFVIFVRRTRVVFDRPSGAMVIRVTTVKGETVQEVALATISAASVETRISKSGRGNRRRVPLHRVVLRVAGHAAPLPLMEVFTAGEAATEAAEKINAWMAS